MNCNEDNQQESDRFFKEFNDQLQKETNETGIFLPAMIKNRTTLKPTFKDAIPQIIASCIIHCIVIQGGINMAYSTVLNNGLQKAEGKLRISKDQESWIASLVTISLPIGSLLTGPLMDKFGRKSICLLTCIPASISWILILLSNSISTIYAGRVIAGASAGLSTVGILITCCLAVWLRWDTMAAVFLVLNCCVFLALFIVPESPYWLMCFSNGMLNENSTGRAEKSLKWLNRREIIYEQEYARIKEISSTRVMNAESSKTLLQSINLFYKELMLPTVYKPMCILFFLLLLQQLSGAYVVIFYAISVFKEIGGTFGAGLDAYGALVMLGVIRFIMSILTAYFSKRYGRRVLCISSGLGMTFSMFFSAMYMYLTSSCDENGTVKQTMANQKWLLLVIVLFYVCTSSLGFVVIPWTLIGELLPISVRGTGSGLMVSLAYIMMFGVIKSYPYAIEGMGGQGIFFFFSFTSLLGTSFVYFFLPETLGRTFTEIEQYFTTNRKTRSC
ncbi:facilitated trehalose transporter Tret1-2 homolog isoform X2 [Cephus cinctus]|uniref:Facilitated trehalose transporter Tret1-2 homolog isoform X2 n=1 Tax=Cephus cinctus TaxID=211228 RepID=A0AAJ7FLF3_CEPCN|nr:facilitated trehalose transporter Tret1-2 homolog isoform X2 [Cephus cinctus]